MFNLFKKKEVVKTTSKIMKHRSFAAGSISRLTSDWSTSNSTPNSDIFADLIKIRARARNLVQNNGYAKKFVTTADTNVVGTRGISLQCMFKDVNGKYDKEANQHVEKMFIKWAKKCDVTKTMTWVEFQSAFLTAYLQDGEAIARKVVNFKNEFGFALQLIEADHLDINLNDSRRNIVMGIEFDEFSSPLAYHFTKSHPSAAIYNGNHIRVPADEIIHLFDPLRVGQVRGVTRMHAGMSALNMLDKYQEAELTAARVAAGKMGFFKTPTGNEYGGGKDGDDVIMEVEPGTFEELPSGWEFESFDPQHPSTAFETFQKTVLRSVASAWGISYESLSNDRSSVNFSSIRQGSLEERDTWKKLQKKLTDKLHENVYESWLPQAILFGKVELPMSKIDKFLDIIWQPRGFTWIDPLKDAMANIALSKEGLKTHQDIVAETGKNIEDVYDQLEKEKKMREDRGITTNADATIFEMMANVIKIEGEQK